MPGIGTVVNCLAVIVGCAVGTFVKKGLSARFQDILMKALGLSTMFIGASGALTGLLSVEGGSLSTKGTMLMIFSLVIGSGIGEAVRIEDRLETLGEGLKRALKADSAGGRFVEGFVTNTLVICVGAMAVVGSLNDGLFSDPSTLFAKALLDGIIGLVFASTLGIGTLFAVLPLAVYQGSITLFARLVEPYLTDSLISDLGYVGSVLIFAVGINLAFGKKFKVGNMLPAILIPVVWSFLSIG